MGIIVCGLNGDVKSILEKIIAGQLNCIFIDIEELYFQNKEHDYTYAYPCTYE